MSFCWLSGWFFEPTNRQTTPPINSEHKMPPKLINENPQVYTKSAAAAAYDYNDSQVDPFTPDEIYHLIKNIRYSG
jgi:hypothetical protein